MKQIWMCMVFFLACSPGEKQATQESTLISDRIEEVGPEYAMVLHGGAGYMTEENLPKDRQALFRASIRRVLDKGQQILSSGGSSLDAVEQCIKMMENDSLFNAGKGAVLNHRGEPSLDASIMLGSDLSAGAVAGISRAKNPIAAARAVMERSPHVLLSGEGADQFAGFQGLEMVSPDYFITSKRVEALREAREAQRKREEEEEARRFKWGPNKDDKKFGTVGVVALDKYGQIAAGTSTGGMTNKQWGRIGDSPVIGAGTYADNRTAGISCTGHGEYFIRHAVAYDVVARMKYLGSTLQESASEVIHHTLKAAGGDGGLVGLDRRGNIVMEFNTPGMFRGYVKPGESEVFIFSR